MYKAIIVDDEQFAIDGLRECVDWANYGIEVIGEANNGEEALEFLDNNHIDILFTDVVMPIMDGMNLIKEVRNRDLDIKIVVLSGYEDFEFARTAIHYNVIDYILKPATLDSIEKVVNHLMEKCQEEEKMIEERSNHIKALEEAVPLIEEKFFINLFDGNYDQEVLELYNLDVVFDKYLVIKGKLDQIIPQEESVDYQRKLKDIKFKVINKCAEYLKDTERSKWISIDINTIALVIMLDKKSETRYIKHQLNSILKMSKLTDLSYSYGIGSTVKRLENVHMSYCEASKALEHKLYYGSNSVIVFQEMKQVSPDSHREIKRLKSDLSDQIINKNKDDASRVLRQIFNELKDKNEYTIEYVRQLSMELILVIAITLTDHYSELESIYNKQKNLLQYILRLNDLEEIFKVLDDVCMTTIDYLREGNTGDFNSIVRTILEYMSEHMEEDITLDLIAEKVYLTPNYVGHLFKEEMGVNYLEYLTQIRMEKAKQLLVEPGRKIYEVSIMVGYKNPNYFGKIFKQYTGFTPSQFKNYA